MAFQVLNLFVCGDGQHTWLHLVKQVGGGLYDCDLANSNVKQLLWNSSDSCSEIKNETFAAQGCSSLWDNYIAKESLKRTTKWSAKYFTHAKSFYPFPTSSMELADVEVMKPPTAARIDPAIEVAMKELVDKYSYVRQRTVQSETTRDKFGALPPAVCYTQPPHSKVMFHDDSTVEGREGIEQIMPQVSDDDGDSHVRSITFVDSKVEIVAVGEVLDQEDEYDTDSGNDMDDDDHDSYPHTTKLTRSGRAIRAHFRLDF